MKVSVVMSTYNRPALLKRAVKSVVDQTFKDWELIIVHDGKAKRKYTFSDPRIFFMETKEHRGNDTHPKNVGIMESTGDYIAFLDDDNEFTPDHLMILVKEAGKNPDVDVLYGDRLVVSDDNEFEPQLGIASDWNPGFLMERNFIDTSDVLVKRETLFMVGGFDERYEKYIDWNLWVRMMKTGKIAFLHVPKVITTYHIHKDMKSVRVKDRIGERPLENMNPEPVFKPAWDGFELEIILPYLGKKLLPKVAVFTLCMNRLAYTKVMYKSLKKAGYPLDWYPIDQGSTDGTTKWLKKLGHTKDIHVYPIYNKSNTGISIGSNQAIKAMKEAYDFIIKIDNDCEALTDKWLDKLLHIFAAHWQIILSPYVEGLIDNPGGSARMGYKKLRGHLIGITKHIGGIFVMAHKSAYDTFRWDERDFLHSMQDLIFSTEMQKKGFLVGYVEDMRVSHQQTTEGQKKQYPDYFKKRIFERTHTFEREAK